MKRKSKHFIAIAMAIILIFSSNTFATPINLTSSSETITTDTLNKDSGTDYFNDETTNVWNNGTITEETRVAITKESVFEITIPKEVILDGSTSKADYVINAKGDIAGDQILTIIPDNTFTMSETGGKADITANITQSNTYYKYQDLLNDGTNYIGHIKTSLTAGQWSGSFYFNINFSEIEPSETMIIYTTVDDNTQQSATYNSITELKSFTTGNEDLKTVSLINSTQTMPVMSVMSISEENSQNVFPSDLSGLFKNCINLKIINFTGFNVNKNTDVTEMFANCPKLTDENIIRLEKHKLVNLPCIRGHEYTDEITKESTCIDQGLKTYTCTRCDASYTKSIAINPDNHDYDEGIITKEATCTETGVMTYTCKRCHNTCIEDIAIDITNHNYTSEITEQPTCINQGVKTYTCTRCNSFYTEAVPIDSSNHNYVAVPTKQATCTEEGIMTYICSRCDDIEKTEPIPKLSHTYDEGIVTKQPTCTETGIMTYTCICGDIHLETIAINPNNHDYNEGVVTKEATCTEKGVKTYTCSRCHGTKTEEIAINPNNHDYDEGVVTKEATCTEKGVKTYTCSRCHGTKTEEIAINLNNHTYNEGVITKVATCTEIGIKTFTCTRCNNIRTENINIDSTNHNYTSTMTKEPTCTEQGENTIICTRCHDTYTEPIPIVPTNHNYESSITKEATCTEDGILSYICTHCGDIEKTEPISKTGHSYNNGVITKEANCTETGVMTYTCTKCNDTYTNTIQINSNHNYVAVPTKQATCTEEGIITYICSRCDDIEKTESIPMIEHTYGSGVVTRQPTCTKTGVMSYTCLCGHIHLEDIPINSENHNYDAGVITKTGNCTEKGVLTHTCSRCNNTYTEDIPINPENHNYDDVTRKEPTCTENGYIKESCSRCGKEMNTEVIEKLGHKSVLIQKYTNYALVRCTRCGYEHNNYPPEAPTIEMFPVTINNVVKKGRAITFTATLNNPENDEITYEWQNRPSETYSEYAVGTHTIKCRAKDEFGNYSSWSSFTFTVKSDAAVEVNINEKSNGVFDVVGNGNIKTTFANNGYTSVAYVNGSQNNISGTTTISGVDFTRRTFYDENLNASVTTYTITNTTSDLISDVRVAVHSDIQVNKNDSAACTINNNGFSMTDGTYTFQVYAKNTPGIDDCSTIWIGRYSQRTSNLWVNGPNSISGIDSGFTMSWQFSLRPNQTITKTFMICVE